MMITKNKKPHLFLAAITAPLTLLAGNAGAAALIYEGFDYATGSLSGGSGGTGFTGNWSTHDEVPTVASPGMNWGSLPVTGNSVGTSTAGGGGGAARNIGTTSVLDGAGLMGNGQTLWFSVIVNKPADGNSNVSWNFALGSDGFHAYTAPGGVIGERNNLETGEGIGFGLQPRNGTQMDIESLYWQNTDADDNAERIRNGSDALDLINRWNGPTVLVVGRIDWGADDLANETLTLYAPDTSLALGTGKTWNTIPALDQSAFDTVAFSVKGGSIIDEIRFGATYNDVLTVPVPEPSSLTLLGLTGLALLRRRR